MELLKPDYYDEFTCIADKCTISCCREWKINIDDETYRNWKTIQPPSEVPGHRSCLQAYTMKKYWYRRILIMALVFFVCRKLI